MILFLLSLPILKGYANPGRVHNLKVYLQTPFWQQKLTVIPFFFASRYFEVPILVQTRCVVVSSIWCIISAPNNFAFFTNRWSSGRILFGTTPDRTSRQPAKTSERSLSQIWRTSGSFSLLVFALSLKWKFVPNHKQARNGFVLDNLQEPLTLVSHRTQSMHHVLALVYFRAYVNMCLNLYHLPLQFLPFFYPSLRQPRENSNLFYLGTNLHSNLNCCTITRTWYPN